MFVRWDVDARSNRTFMELKFMAAIQNARTAACSNRTFMELKYIILRFIIVCKRVLIVPLWN